MYYRYTGGGSYEIMGPTGPIQYWIQDFLVSVLLLYATATTTPVMYAGCKYSTGISLSASQNTGVVEVDRAQNIRI